MLAISRCSPPNSRPFAHSVPPRAAHSSTQNRRKCSENLYTRSLATVYVLASRGNLQETTDPAEPFIRVSSDVRSCLFFNSYPNRSMQYLHLNQPKTQNSKGIFKTPSIKNLLESNISFDRHTKDSRYSRHEKIKIKKKQQVSGLTHTT